MAKRPAPAKPRRAQAAAKADKLSPNLEWRRYLREYLIIVIGVATALTGQSIVDNLEWARRVRSAETDMKEELADNARFAFERLAASACYAQRNAELRDVLVANRDDGAPIPVQPRYGFGRRTWSSETWENARALQLTGHMPTDRLRAYARAFWVADAYRNQQLETSRLLPSLETLRTNAGRISNLERDRLFLALQTMEADSGRLDSLAMRFLEASRDLNMEVSTADKRRILAFLSNIPDASVDAACVSDPSARIAADNRRSDWFKNERK